MLKLGKQQKRLCYSIIFPALFETILNQVFHMADSIMLGQMPNSTLAVAAVGLCASPSNIIIGMASNFFIGTTATIAWYYGAGKKKNLRSIAWQSMLVAFGIATFMAGISLIFARPIMQFVCGKGDLLGIATDYYRINGIGFFFQILTMCITACFRGIGITKLPMVYNLLGGGVNVVLNYLLIYGKCGLPALRAVGAAWATSISKILIFVIAFAILLFTKSDIRFTKEVSFKRDPMFRKRLLPIGITAAGEQMVLQSGALLMSKIVATLPVAHIAANQIVVTIEGFAWAGGGACAVAATSLFGRSIGEGNLEKGKAYLRFILKFAVLFALAEVAIFITLGRPMAALYTSDQSLYPMIVRILRIAACMLPLLGTHQSISGALRSAGDSIAPLLASILSLWLFRLVPGFILVNILGMGVYAYRWCIFADQLVRLITVSCFYFSGHWKKKLK